MTKVATAMRVEGWGRAGGGFLRSLACWLDMLVRICASVRRIRLWEGGERKKGVRGTKSLGAQTKILTYKLERCEKLCT